MQRDVRRGDLVAKDHTAGYYVVAWQRLGMRKCDRRSVLSGNPAFSSIPPTRKTRNLGAEGVGCGL